LSIALAMIAAELKEKEARETKTEKKLEVY
jgi:hypothetical protein